MEYSCYTIYDRHTLADMSRALRKTVRKKTARRWWMAGCLLLVLGLSLLLEPNERLWFKAVILVAVVCLFVVQGWGDGLNALMAQRRMLPGSELCSSSFYGDHYECKISGATTSWEYGNILAIAETRDYLVFVLGKNHAQAFAKRELKGGTVDSFRSFLEQKVGKPVEKFGG